MADDQTTEATTETTTDAPGAEASPTAEPKPPAKTTKKKSKRTTKKSAKTAAKKTTRKRTTKKTASQADDDAPDNAPEDASPAADPSSDESADTKADQAPEDDGESESPAKPRKKRSRRKKTPAKAADASTDETTDDTDADDDDAPAPAEGESTEERALEPDDDQAAPATPVAEAPSEMIINYTPGEDCRIAIIEDGKLEEFDAEPTQNVSRVGNIYRGKVVNIERNIQAAFVDFGTEEAGFLHLSDLHPRYFPGAGDDETERVGRKTPRRQRPPIEKALKKGQEITVQVLKEGVGTKGPTLTSYLSIPGRFLVMMPDMDKVGVSRKVEDEDLRKKMRKILDQLDLPEGFGFILRTAGLDRTKTDLKRDLAYLQRLWKDMERKRKKGKGPALLYSEADLLLRTIRDRVTNQVKRVVIDNPAALARAAGFMKIVSPRAATKLCLYDEKRPIFHAFGIEEQLELMHATEVPLPSGGALVMEQTEALVAIDVNSGRSRGARDAEANAYNTNVEAVDEICRQLRLRDLGGLVICDLIDMRHASNRKDIENRFKDRLKRDRARSTTLPISAFGILEMTRQRMRGSYEQAHFHTCPRCAGRGLIQRPDSIAASALRDLTALLEHDRVHRVELVVSPVVAGALLSTRRGTLGRIERLSGKRIDVHVKETLAPGRVVTYAYDSNGADIDVERLPRKKSKPRIIEWDKTDLAKSMTDAGEDWAVDLEQEAEEAKEELAEEATAHEQAEAEKIAALDLPSDEDDEESSGKKKRKRRRRRRRKSGDDDNTPSDANKDSTPGDKADASAEDQPGKKGKTDKKPDAEPSDNTDASGKDDADTENRSEDGSEGSGKKQRRRRRRRRRSGDNDDNKSERDSKPDEQSNEGSKTASEPKADRKPESSDNDQNADAAPSKPKRKRRALYGSGRRSLSASEKSSIERD